jgi:hypothetical protein
VEVYDGECGGGQGGDGRLESLLVGNVLDGRHCVLRFWGAEDVQIYALVVEFEW